MNAHRLWNVITGDLSSVNTVHLLS